MPIQYIARRPTALPAIAKPNAAVIYVDSDDNTLKVIPAGSGTVEVPILTGAVTTVTADGAIPIATGIYYITKGSAAALTVAAPGAAGIGTRLTITSGSAFAHVITFTGGTLWDGTTGANTTVTMTAFAGSSITVVGLTATLWGVESQNTLTSIA